MKSKEKKHISPNECSFGRWIAVLVVGSLFGLLLATPLVGFFRDQTGTFMGLPRSQIVFNLIFAAVFWGLVIALKVVGKTSLKDFVLAMSGIDILGAVLSYGVTGMLFFFVSLYFGSLMPAIIVHWVNNFILSTLISSEMSVISAPTLLVDNTPHTAAMMLLSNFAAWVPLLVYIFVDHRKKKQAAAVSE